MDGLLHFSFVQIKCQAQLHEGLLDIYNKQP